jgi:RNA-directed DNA polymerase
MEGRPPRSTFVQGSAQKARAQPPQRCGHLSEWLPEASLRACWPDIRQAAADGGDHVSAEADAQPLEENRRDLGARLTGKRDRATRVKRHDIPTGNGPRRPLGSPAVEDTLRQRAVARLLDAIDEPDCRRWSDGYRPKVGALDAVDKRTRTRQVGPYHVVVEADINGFFANIPPGWLSRMLAERLEDGALRRLMRQWLKAGVLETDGQVMHPATGSPPGGVISPILAHGSLHEALDRWFQKVVKPRCRGEACLIRDAADAVAACQDQADAEPC